MYNLYYYLPTYSKLKRANSNFFTTFIFMIFYFFSNTIPIMSQLHGVEKTMEQFLDGLLHHSVYDRRIRPFSNVASRILTIFITLISI